MPGNTIHAHVGSPALAARPVRALKGLQPARGPTPGLAGLDPRRRLRVPRGQRASWPVQATDVRRAGPRWRGGSGPAPLQRRAVKTTVPSRYFGNQRSRRLIAAATANGIVRSPSVRLASVVSNCSASCSAATMSSPSHRARSDCSFLSRLGRDPATWEPPSVEDRTERTEECWGPVTGAASSIHARLAFRPPSPHEVGRSLLVHQETDRVEARRNPLPIASYVTGRFGTGSDVAASILEGVVPARHRRACLEHESGTGRLRAPAKAERVPFRGGWSCGRWNGSGRPPRWQASSRWVTGCLRRTQRMRCSYRGM